MAFHASTGVLPDFLFRFYPALRDCGAESHAGASAVEARSAWVASYVLIQPKSLNSGDI